MIVDFGGRLWEFNPGSIGYKHGMVIQLYTGMSIADWEDSLDFKADEQGNLKNPPPEWLKSLGALYWLMRAQAGDKVAIDDIDFDFQAFLVAFVEGTAAELKRQRAAEAAKPDPTSPPPSPGGPPSSMPAIPTVTTLTPPVPQAGGPAIAFT